ncbi:hypothetical protein ERX37_07950 [Macrococcus hajekii]|uniref:Uncharacterized protein n=1 Tax=Macrococcus hajekii TaxID=198482 RepID=A0A4R6BIG2_9STAP|nr:hypothetical protein [Macrococcus hajekii]TDM01425.1 hypothetical protein ERX37_07950 [Macrococcus hajekii]GGA99867.1 hypothetical protein GCM10007190_04900 [Macrococcus hajekii]
MIKEAMQYIAQHTNRRYRVGDRTFLIVDERLQEITEPIAKAFKIATLSGLVDYLNSDFDTDQEQIKLSVVVHDHRTVKVMGQLNDNADRDQFLVVEAELPAVTLGSYLELEEFNVQMQSVFVPNEETANVLRLVGNIRSENVRNQSDNGITQSVEVRQGIATVGSEQVPNPVHLKPFRTFTEVTQPESAFVFRLREGRNGVEAALFEADGGAWKNVARKSIADYLRENINRKNVTILS